METINTILGYYATITIGLGIITGLYHAFKKIDLLKKMDPDSEYLHLLASPTIYTHAFIFSILKS